MRFHSLFFQLMALLGMIATFVQYFRTDDPAWMATCVGWVIVGLLIRDEDR